MPVDVVRERQGRMRVRVKSRGVASFSPNPIVRIDNKYQHAISTLRELFKSLKYDIGSSSVY